MVNALLGGTAHAPVITSRRFNVFVGRASSNGPVTIACLLTHGLAICSMTVGPQQINIKNNSQTMLITIMEPV